MSLKRGLYFWRELWDVDGGGTRRAFSCRSQTRAKEAIDRAWVPSGLVPRPHPKLYGVDISAGSSLGIVVDYAAYVGVDILFVTHDS